MTEQLACTLCGAGGHTAAQCNWREQEAFEEAVAKRQGKSIAWVASFRDESTLGYMAASMQHAWWAWQARAALAQPSPISTAQDWACPEVDHCQCMGPCALAPTQPSPAPELELEQPEVVAYRTVGHHPEHRQPHYALNYYAQNAADQAAHWRERGCEVVEDELMTVAQHERIAGAQRADRDSWEQQASDRVADWDAMRQERDAAQARVAELEKQEPVAWYKPHWSGSSAEYRLGAQLTDAVFPELWKPLYAAPVAQAGQVPEGWRVVHCTSSSRREGDKWEVYDPQGSGGVVSVHDVKDWAVRGLLDALAAAPAQGMPTEAELEAAGLGYPLSKEEAVALWNDRSVVAPGGE